MLLPAVVLIPSKQAAAQQGIVFSQYLFNGLMINPAYAGYREVLNANVLYRNQWAGLENAPTTISMLMDGAVLNDMLGVGGHVMNDRVGAQQTLSLFSNYSYRIRLDNAGTRLSLGLSIGVTQLSLDENLVRFNNPNDPILTSGLLNENVYRPDFNVGVFFDHKRFAAGLSVTELWRDYKLVQKNPQMYLTFAALFPINRDYTLKPSFMYKDDFQMQPSVDLNVFLIVKDKIWAGLSWRNGLPFGGRLEDAVRNMAFQTSLNALTVIGQVYVTENFYLGYAYDFPLSRLNQVSLGSHEIMLGFRMGRRTQRVLTPRYF